jgi:hypothetical protein
VLCHNDRTMTETSEETTRRPHTMIAVAAIAALAIVIAGVSWWLVRSEPAPTSLDTVREIVSQLEQEQNQALDNADSYISYLRERNYPGAFDLADPSWVQAENFYRAHWEVSNLRQISDWFAPDVSTVSPDPDWAMPQTECSEPIIPGSIRGTEVFSVRDRKNPNIVHQIAITGGEGYVFSPLCNLTPWDKVTEARAALEQYLADEAAAKAEGPYAYFDFIYSTNYPGLYDTSTGLWRLGEIVFVEAWERSQLFRPDIRDLDSIGILDITFDQGVDGCSPSRTTFPASMWVVTTPGRGGEPYVEYFQYHEGVLHAFVALCNVQPVVNERGEIILTSLD